MRKGWRVLQLERLGVAITTHRMGKGSSNLGPGISLLSWGSWFSWRALGRKGGCCKAGGDHGVEVSGKLTWGEGIMGVDEDMDSHGVRVRKRRGRRVEHVPHFLWHLARPQLPLRPTGERL